MIQGRGIDDSEAETRQVRVPVAEERISVEKRTREIGEVLLQRAVTEEQHTLAIDVGRETLRVTRRTTPARPAAPGEVEAAFAAGVTRIPVFGEAAAVAKRAFVTGEVVVHRREVVESRLFTETVRREAVETEMVRPETEVGAVREPQRATGVAGGPVARDADREAEAGSAPSPEGSETRAARDARTEGMPIVRPAALWREVREGWSRGRSRS